MAKNKLVPLIFVCACNVFMTWKKEAEKARTEFYYYFPPWFLHAVNVHATYLGLACTGCVKTFSTFYKKTHTYTAPEVTKLG